MTTSKKNPPTTDAELPSWASNVSEHISETPAEFAVTAQIAAEYASKLAAYVSLLAISRAPQTAGKMATFNKNAAKAELLEMSRQLASTIGGNLNVTDAQRTLLGLTIRKHGAPVPPPSQAPDLDYIGVAGSKLRFRIHNADTVSRRRKPRGAIGAQVWSWSGSAPPVDWRTWTPQGLFTSQTVTLDFGLEVAPGTKVWVVAQWYSRRGELGPVSEPLEARLPGNVLAGGAQQGEDGATGGTFMKAA